MGTIVWGRFSVILGPQTHRMRGVGGLKISGFVLWHSGISH